MQRIFFINIQMKALISLQCNITYIWICTTFDVSSWLHYTTNIRYVILLQNNSDSEFLSFRRFNAYLHVLKRFLRKKKSCFKKIWNQKENVIYEIAIEQNTAFSATVIWKFYFVLIIFQISDTHSALFIHSKIYDWRIQYNVSQKSLLTYTWYSLY